MRLFINRTSVKRLLLVFVGVLFIESSVQAKPERIVSMNLCTDQLLMMLADKDHISSVSYLAADHESSALSDQATNYQLNHGLAEEIISLSPDLVLASEFTTKITTGLLQDLGYNIVTIPVPSTIQQVIENIRLVANTIGESQRGEDMIAEMQARLSKTAFNAQNFKPVVAALYWANSYTSGKGTLANELVEAAGFQNLGKNLNLYSTTKLPLEILVFNEVDVLIIGSRNDSTPAMASENLHHPVLKSAFNGLPVINVPHQLWICGTPRIVDVVEQLQTKYQAAIQDKTSIVPKE